MTRIFTTLFILFLLVDGSAYSQAKDNNENAEDTLPQHLLPIDKYNIDTNCYEGGQQEINYCLSQSEKKLIDILQIKYDCIIAYFDIEIKKYSTLKADSSELAERKLEKQYLVSSQITWKKLLDEDASFWSFSGGTITPMLIAESMLKDTKDRLKWLDNIIEEEGQGNVIEVLKCK